MPAIERLESAARSYSAAAIRLDHGYYPRPGAHIYTSAYLTGKLTTRFYASILLTPDHTPFELRIGGAPMTLHAAAVRPLIECGKKGLSDGPMVTVHLDPMHPHFRAFRALERPGVLPLDRSRFASLDAELRAAVSGDLPLDAVTPLVDKIAAIVAPQLPRCGPQDERVVKVCELLSHAPCVSLEDIAASLRLSYDRTSHLFTEAVGLPFRSYQLWRKVRRANRLLWSGETLTTTAHAAGFADSAHLCRTYQQVFGRPPSYFFDDRFVKIHAHRPLPSTVSSIVKREGKALLRY